MAARLNSTDLQARPTRIRELLRPLVADFTALNVRQLNGVADYVLGPVPFGSGFGNISDPDELRIPTRWDGLYFNYHEIWQYDGSKFYDLNRAYLHLYLARGRSSDDLNTLCLHCDPVMKIGEQGYAYKRGPHLHLMTANPDIARAHISLCIGDNQFGGNKVSAVMSRMKKSVQLIADEVAPRYFH